jgi:hypothetical protein
MTRIRICTICGRHFFPNKYHPHQEVCSDKECQKERQLKNQKTWRNSNPHYFRYKDRNTEWEKKRAVYLKNWREKHRDYFKNYRLKKKQNSELNLEN